MDLDRVILGVKENFSHLQILLFKNYSLKIGLLFFLNPISIIITGHHNQFTNFALLFGFLSVLLYEKNNLNFKIILPLIIMGLSLSVKHVLIFFPIWWAFKEKRFLFVQRGFKNFIPNAHKFFSQTFVGREPKTKS